MYIVNLDEVNSYYDVYSLLRLKRSLVIQDITLMVYLLMYSILNAVYHRGLVLDLCCFCYLLTTDIQLKAEVPA